MDGTVFSIGQAFGDLLGPYVDAALATLISAGLAALGAWLKQKWGFEVDAKARDAIQTALTNGAHSLVARGQVRLDGIRIDVGSVFLRRVAEELVARNKDSAARLGLTPEKVAAMLVEHLPKVPAVAQAQAAALAPPANIATNIATSAMRGKGGF